MAVRIAVASSDGKVVNEHFGRAEAFYILDAKADGSYEILEHREVGRICNSGEHDEDALQKRVESLRDCEYVLVSRIGPGAENALEEAGVIAYQIPDVVDEAIRKMLAYIEINRMLYGTLQL